MSVRIRLTRQGAKKKPQYLVVVVEGSKKRDGAYLEKLGHYFPLQKLAKDKVKIDVEATKAWIAKGAQMSVTVGQLFEIATK
jgi:small subunit ribosomal protein S16